MTQLPQTRDEYRARLMHDIFRLVQHIEADDNEHSSAESLARGIGYDVREYFNVQRWKPSPVHEGICARVPLEQPLTLLMQFHDGENGRRILQGRIQVIRHPGRPHDGAEFEIIPRGCRKARRYWYRAGPGAALTVYPGWLEGRELERRRPLYEHEAAPRIEYQKAAQ